MTKKILKFFLVLTLTLTLTACFNSQKDQEEAKAEAEAKARQLEVNGVTETGTVLDITDKNGQTVNGKVGDVLYLKLEGESNKGKQWVVISPTSGNYLRLKDHKVVGLLDPKVLNGKFTDEWWLKLDSQGSFELKYNYGVLGKTAEKTFSVNVVTQ